MNKRSREIQQQIERVVGPLGATVHLDRTCRSGHVRYRIDLPGEGSALLVASFSPSCSRDRVNTLAQARRLVRQIRGEDCCCDL